MITVFIYTSKSVHSSVQYYEKGDVHSVNVCKTLLKGGGLFKFNGTKEEFIDKVVSEKYKNQPTGYFLHIYNVECKFAGLSALHIPANEDSFISGMKLNETFINYLKDEFGIPKTYLSRGNNGAGIFIVEEDNLPELKF